MTSVSLKAPAKINLSLDIVGRRTDGYHLLRTIMQTVDLADVVTIQMTSSKKIELSLSDETIPSDERNTAYKAAKLFYEKTELPFEGISITIQKWIPSQAGMAGGSADAAAVLKGLNQLHDMPLSMEQLCDLAVKIGADVPFCVRGGAALATGIGEVLTPVKGLSSTLSVVVCKPPVGISTAQAYEAVDEKLNTVSPSEESKLLEGLETGNAMQVGAFLHNAFEQALENSDVNAVLERMCSYAPLGCRMTGSGSAVFALFDMEQEARDCAFGLMDLGQVYICHPC